MVIEATPKTYRAVGETLSAQARPLLQALGIWEEFSRAGHLPCHGSISAWGSDDLAERDLVFSPYGNAWQLDRMVFDEMLLSAAKQAGALVRRGQLCEDFRRDGEGWRIELTGETIRANWLIDATGRRSMVARGLGAKREIVDQLVAIYGTAISMSGTDQDGRTFIESAPDGWWYSTLTPGGRRTVSFQTDADLFPAQEWRSGIWFAERIGRTRYLSGVLAVHAYKLPEAPQLTSAHSGRSGQYLGDRWLAVGDAAMSFDPLSGQGILNAMTTAVEAAKVVIDETPESQNAYQELNQSTWKYFLQKRRSYYMNERRWPEQAFWSRRGRRFDWRY
jgi:flavin-dependent dehydrogenase